MTKEKQIEEMFNIIVDGVIDGEDNNGVPTGNTCTNIAKALYEAGYRKADEEEIDAIKKGMHFLLYSMCLQLNLGREIFVKYKIQLNNWFENYKNSKKIGAKTDGKEAEAEATEKWNKRINEEDK